MLYIVHIRGLWLQLPSNMFLSEGVKKENSTKTLNIITILSLFNPIQFQLIVCFQQTLFFPCCAHSHRQIYQNFCVCVGERTEMVCLMKWNERHVETHLIRTHDHMEWHGAIPYTSIRQLNFAWHMQKFHITAWEAVHGVQLPNTCARNIDGIHFSVHNKLIYMKFPRKIEYTVAINVTCMDIASIENSRNKRTNVNLIH